MSNGTAAAGVAPPQPKPVRSNSISQVSENSQTAAEFISSQLQLEADAREALPYAFDTCTKPLGPLRQSLFSCLTCNPPPASLDAYTPAGVCYSCSISCHGEHTLVELFSKRNFVCDCGTKRLPSTSPCTLRIDEATGRKSNEDSEEPAPGNKYNQNFRNIFCGCGEDYDPHQERGTMFQCVGLGTVEDGGCGEDWWHPECVVGYRRQDWKSHVDKVVAERNAKAHTANSEIKVEDGLATIAEGETTQPVVAHQNGAESGVLANDNDQTANEEDEDEDVLPEGFPREDDFEYFICYKCTASFPWIKAYAGTEGFLPAVLHNPEAEVGQPLHDAIAANTDRSETKPLSPSNISKKRKASEDEDECLTNLDPNSLADRTKRQRSEQPVHTAESVRAPQVNGSSVVSANAPRHAALPPASTGQLSLFLKPDFRSHLCRCNTCYPLLKPHPALLAEEETYEPALSESGVGEGNGSVGTGSILDRGEAAFSNMDRVRAIEGAMVYNQLKEKVKGFLKPFAESGQAVGAEDIKKYFEGLRGDVEAMKTARGEANQWRRDADGDADGGGASKKEQSGY